MEESPSNKPVVRSASQEIPCLLLGPDVYHGIHKSSRRSPF
jgi:hypothetical protein